MKIPSGGLPTAAMSSFLISVKVAPGAGVGAQAGRQKGSQKGGSRQGSGGGAAPPPGFFDDDEEDLFSQLLRRGGPPPSAGSRTLPINPQEAFFIQVDTDKEEAYVGEQITVSFYIYTRGGIRDRT